VVFKILCRHLLQPGLQKGSWTKEEDHVVKSMVMEIGVAKVKWSYVAEHVCHSRTILCTCNDASHFSYVP
jgi:hypothetical protein